MRNVTVLFFSFLFIGCAKKPPETASSSNETSTSSDAGVAEEAPSSSEESEAVILGALDKSLIDKEIKTAMPEILQCYQQELTNRPNLSGKLKMKIVIGTDGNVNSVKPVQKDTTLDSEVVANCIAERMMQLVFPKPSGGGIVIVQYPFLFSSEE